MPEWIFEDIKPISFKIDVFVQILHYHLTLTYCTVYIGKVTEKSPALYFES